MVVPCALEPVDLIGDLIGAVVAGLVVDPPGRAPRQSICHNFGVAGEGLLHEPELVTSGTVEVVSAVHVRRFSAVSGLGISAYLHFANVKIRSKLGLVQVVEDLGGHLCAVVCQQSTAGPG